MKQETVYAAKSIVRSSLGVVRKPIAVRNFKQAIEQSKGSLKICAGAGKNPRAGWLNTDVSWHAQNYLNLLKPWDVPFGAVTHVYMDNVIEHFPLRAGREVLRNAYAALASGGGIRLATPDVERAARLYLENGDFVERALERNRQTGYEVHHSVDLLRVMFNEADHHVGYLFDQHALTQELEMAGFVKIERLEVGESNDSEFVGLESRTGPEEALTTLVLEARKP